MLFKRKYGGELGLVWIDAHSDLGRIVGYDYGHTLPLGNLLGEGDEEFAKHVNVPLKPENVFIAGINVQTDFDTEIIQRLGIKTAGIEELMNSSASIKDWIKQNNIKHLAIHLDLDVLDSKAFRSLLFANPEVEYDFSAAGTMQLPGLLHLIQELSEEADVVGLGITEHMPWEIPILNK